MGNRPKYNVGIQRTFIREWRESRKWTQEELVEKAGRILGAPVALTTLSRLERGEVPYEQYKMQAYADVFGCTVADLLTGPPTDAMSADGTYVLSEPVKEAILAAMQMLAARGSEISDDEALAGAKFALASALAPPLHSAGLDRVSSVKARIATADFQVLRSKKK
jgi:transcriptional regulator with XRE-family HTH domain